jgi:hypothetical protein
MRIRVPIDQIELVYADLKRIENRLAQNRTLLNKAWSTILLESLVKVRINNTFLQSNMLAGRIQSSDAEMSNYLQRVVSDFLEADNRNTSIIKKLAGSSKVLSRDGAVSIRDRLLSFRKMYIALALLGPLALLYPAATALNWVKERMAAKLPHQPTPGKVDKKPEREQSQPLREQTTGGPEPLTTEEQEQLARNGMTEEQFRRWKEETGWQWSPDNPGGWPVQPESIAVTSYPDTQEVDSFYGIPAMARLNGYGLEVNNNPLGSFNEYGTYVPAEGGIYNCAEYVKRFYDQNEQHGLFGDREIQNVTNLIPGRVPIVSYGDGTTEAMASLDIANGDILRPGDVYYANNHWAIIKGVDPQTNEIIIIEQNYNGTFGIQYHQPERRVPIDGGNYYRISDSA